MSQRLPHQPQRIGVPNAAFEAAISLHRQGRLFGAELKYEAQLKSVGDHVGGLRILGLLRMQQGRLEQAAALILKVPCARTR